ncbi:tetratricopeptide repeat protein [Pseudomonas sp. zfem005]|uniref:tetratricopeptide repeat protein n=1 Tax=Pseudomonas sp. zfem005 TaxID=3078200 RepID=UPI002929BEB3|nr:tetratricopeptide repeat protein [Pseudomonas sp. zfem005]MDU9410783.1 tetratricopeptide repeat protein [Pseudomonas sp. zfem005]
MEYWKRTIEAGNRSFHSGDWIEARELYLQALAQAQMLLERWPDADQAVAAFVVSHHNLADLHLMLGQPEETAENLCTCHERLLQVLRDTSLPESLRDVALRHSRCTYSSLLQFIQEHGAYPRTDRLLGIVPGHSSRALPSTSGSRYYH